MKLIVWRSRELISCFLLLFARNLIHPITYFLRLRFLGKQTSGRYPENTKALIFSNEFSSLDRNSVHPIRCQRAAESAIWACGVRVS